MFSKEAKKIIWILSIIIFGLFISSRLFFFKQNGALEKIGATLNYPIILISSKISSPIKKHLEKKRNNVELKKCIETLEEEKETLLLENVKLKATLNYKELSQELIDFQKRYNLNNTILGKILVKNLNDAQHYFIINKGSVDGVKKDMAAIYKFQLLGRVIECYKHYCKVLLITDNSCKVAGFTNTNNAQGIVHGDNKPNTCTLAYVNHLFKIEPGDFVLSSGQGLIFPEGFCIGKIKACTTKNLCHNIELETLIDFKKLDFCFLINRDQGISF